jgi:hypothetical protein
MSETLQVLEFMVPTHRNNGSLINHADFDAYLGQRFGGYTKLAVATGFWKDENIGQVFEETVIPYRVAVRELDVESAISEIAPYIATEYDQNAVYIGRVGTAVIREYRADNDAADFLKFMQS